MRAAVPSILRFASPSRAEDPDETLIGTVISAAEASRATGERQPSYGTIWSVGGAASSTGAVDDGHGRFFHRGTNARLFPASTPGHLPAIAATFRGHSSSKGMTIWNGVEWENSRSLKEPPASAPMRILPSAPFRVLDARNLRDDFYCSVLAYSQTCGILAMGLGNILETDSPRFDIEQPYPVAYVSWRPTEDLLVGDYQGDIFYFVVEWPMSWEVERDNWLGKLTLVARIRAHAQQICGLAWSPKGDLFASGANDNHCCLWSVNQVFGPPRQDAQGLAPPVEDYGSHSTNSRRSNAREPSDETVVNDDGELRTLRASSPTVRNMLPGSEKFRWVHAAAVKAIAFCPWLDGLVATGGGSNDKCIHFFHTTTGAALATITVSAQVTSLIWSTTRRELAATFGYPQPDHPYRIAIFSWPDCKQVAAIPWPGEYRALYAVAYPGISDDGGRRRRRKKTQTPREGCIVVAASDESVKFHEVWAAGSKATVGREGMLGGSDILEGIEGIDKEGDVIR
ncbi:hypothetical protein VUR80DRAFT_7179 [Thermomyces stellatus]